MFGDSAGVVQAGIEMFKDMVQAMPGLPGGAIPDLKAPKGKPAYFGVALTLKPQYGTFDLFVPTTAVQQVRKMLSRL